jgi:tRNA-2-methylthio-N6-dimethylallyladenosine synthase
MHRLYLETVGCQMNLLDSELVVGALRREGYELTENLRDADTVLFNTCSVRQHAEDKIYSALGRLQSAKDRRPELVIAVLGCMAQQDQKRIFHRAPHVDVVCGPGQIGRLPELLDRVRAERRPLLAVSLHRKDGKRDEIQRSFEAYDPLRDPQMRPSPYQAFVRIMFGCDKFCTYCVVPMVRGPEQSRPPEDVLAEVRALARQGTREITLLGQTVNSYRYANNGKAVRLSDLLEQVHGIDGIERIKFVTNFPRDMTPDLLQAVRDLPKVSPYLHVPAQSGSNAVLERMKRGYTVERYREMLAAVREAIPGVAVSSDFIVGFCGETEKEFAQTCDLVEQARFKNSFIFKYSARRGTKADAMMADDVPDEIKRRRNNELLRIQTRISLEDHRERVGSEADVLVEGPSKSARMEGQEDRPVLQLTGRTPCDRIVVFPGHRRLIGQIVRVRIDAASAVTLFGTVLTFEQAGIREAVGPPTVPS